VYLHLRIGTNPNIIGKNPKTSIIKMIYAMRKIYQKHGLGVVIKSIKKFQLFDDLLDLDVGATVLNECGQWLGTTDEQRLFFHSKVQEFHRVKF
jgi:hypothetical protein